MGHNEVLAIDQPWYSHQQYYRTHQNRQDKTWNIKIDKKTSSHHSCTCFDQLSCPQPVYQMESKSTLSTTPVSEWAHLSQQYGY
jgi:hypothetical protein